MAQVYIGLGSNLENPLGQIEQALKKLIAIKGIDKVKISAFYKSKPMGPQNQPDFINAVASFITSMPAEQLLDELHKIENLHGRVRTEHWGARTLDLDILMYGSEVIKTDRLTIPHKGINERNFVLYPLNDLADSDFEIPTLGKLKDLLESCAMDGLQRLDK